MASQEDSWENSVLSTITKRSILAHRQPFLEFTTNRVYFLLLQVAQVHLPPRILPGFLCYGKNLSAEMLKSGWAVTYEQVFLSLLLITLTLSDIYSIGWC